MRRSFLWIIPTLLLGGILGYTLGEKDLSGRSMELFREKLPFLRSSEEKDPQIIRGTGTVEVQEVHISSKTSGYIRELYFSEGETVQGGELLALIHRPDLEARKAQEEANLQRAEFLLADMRTGARPEEIEKVQAQLEGAQARYDQAKKNAERFTELQKEQMVSPQRGEEFQTALDSAASELRALEKQLQVLRLGAREEQIKAQEAAVQALRATVDITKSLLEDTRILAPRGGRILLKNLEEGEYVAPGTVLGVLGDMQDCWVRLYIPSVELGRIRYGQEARIRVDSFRDRSFSGHISEIAGKAAFTPRESLSQEERSNLSFRIKVRVPNPQELLKPGMPADVEILP